MNRISLIILLAVMAVGCGEDKTDATEPTKDPTTKKDTEKAPADSAPLRGAALLVTGNEFGIDDQAQYTVPDSAIMLLLKPDGKNWTSERIAEKESNVFHKALAYGKEGIITIGANKAMVKMWNKEGGKWSSKTLWNPTFGGKQNRLRDFEMADFDGDGKDDLAIATHDQGVVAVLWHRGDKWIPEELDRKESTFVHEIEVGDLDKDGKFEIYATPSQPNTVSGEDQGGKIAGFKWNGTKFEKFDVVVLETRHVKEVLVADMDGDGQQELYAALEAETKGMDIVKPVEIRRFDLKDGKYVDKLVTTIDDRYCRFLVAGDIDGDKKKELVATAFSSGVWLIEKSDSGYDKKCIDAKSGGFEHSAYITDIDGDGLEELYVADDRGGAIKRYTHAAGVYQPKIINKRAVPSQAMIWNITRADL